MAEPLLRVGRYALFGELAAGGMATVHFGRLVGPVGFSRTVAIKRLHPHFAKDVEFVSMFVDEARLAARIQHPNVVPTIDVLQTDDELFLVMEYVPGESLDQLLTLARKQVKPVPLNIAAGIGCGMLHGLHAAHEAKSDSGEPLSLVHRDVSPHNVLVGVDGVPRLLDFGVAKATGRLQVTAEGQVKGKLSYMAPEQLGGDEVTREADLYAAGVVLWEILAGRRLFQAGSDVLLFAKVLGGAHQAPSSYRFEVSEQLDRVVMQALSREPSERFTTAREFALAIEECCPVASAVKIGHWVESLARDSLDARAALIADVEGAHSAPDSETRDSVESMVEATSSKVATAPRGGTGAAPRPSAQDSTLISAGSSPGPSTLRSSEPEGPDTTKPSLDVERISQQALAEQEAAEQASNPHAVEAVESRTSSATASSVSLPVTPRVGEERRASRNMGLALAFFALGGLLTLLLVRARSEIETGSLDDERHEAAPPSIRSAEDESPTASIPSTTMPSEPKTAQPKAAQPKTGQPPRAQAPALAAPAPSGPRPSPAPRTTAAAPPVTAPAPVTPPPAVRADCNPPFTIDARGIQRIKPGCLR